MSRRRGTLVVHGLGIGCIPAPASAPASRAAATAHGGVVVMQLNAGGAAAEPAAAGGDRSGGVTHRLGAFPAEEKTRTKARQRTKTKNKDRDKEQSHPGGTGRPNLQTEQPAWVSLAGIMCTCGVGGQWQMPLRVSSHVSAPAALG